MREKHKLFISYRRVDSVDFVGRLHDNLKDDFDVFLDTEGGLDYGKDFPSALKNGVKDSDVLLLVIGKEWSSEIEKKRDGVDFVVEEIVTAIEHGLRVIPILMNGVDMPNLFPKKIEKIKNLNAFPFDRGEFSIYLNALKREILKEQIRERCDDFTKEVLSALTHKQVVVLYHQEFTPIVKYRESIAKTLSSKFTNNFFEFSIPPFVDSESTYIKPIAQNCNLKAETLGEWYIAIRDRLSSSGEPLVLFIYNIEDGNRELDRKFTTLIRNLKNEFSNFHALFIGQKALAWLVWGAGELSPLNNAKELFFPESAEPLEEDIVVQQFNALWRYREQICRLLAKERVARFTTWSHNETINRLFWKNLLVKEGNYYVWRGESTKRVAKEVLDCDG